MIVKERADYHGASRVRVIWGVSMLLLSVLSCTFPFDRRLSGTQGETHLLKIEFSGRVKATEGCDQGFYPVVLKGLFDGNEIQVTTQSDESGVFSVKAPPGQYIVTIQKGDCGIRETIDLEKNSDLKMEFSVAKTKGFEKLAPSETLGAGRMPASLLDTSSR